MSPTTTAAPSAGELLKGESLTTAYGLRTNSRTTPMGLDSPRPRFTWKIAATESDVVQSSYELEVSDLTDFATTVWSTGRVTTEGQAAEYTGKTLRSATRYFWRVRVWTDDGVPSPWSEDSFETGILDASLWRAQWISTAVARPKAQPVALYVRGSLNLPAPVLRGRAYASALGWYRLFVNGVDLTGSALVPGWTPFDDYIEYQVYDVTEAFRAGANIVGMAVGEGRYRGSNGAARRPNRYGDRLAAFVQVELDLADGSTVRFVTDDSWMAGTGRILSADPQLGERVDLRIPDVDWLGDPVPPTRFTTASVLPPHPRRLIAEETERVQAVTTLTGSVSRTPSGKQLIDFGQNFAGVVSVRLAGPSGQRVRFRYSEVLTPDGELDTGYLSLLGHKDSGEKWFQKDVVILTGDSVVYTSWFTIHGFRYVEVDGLDHDLSPDDIEGTVLSAALPSAGTFECSDPRLNRLHSNVVWSLRSNFTDTATDCPTRERSGWTADIQTFASTSTTIVEADSYLRRYLRNLAAEQLPDGRIPPFIPAESSKAAKIELVGKLFTATSSSAGWGDAAVLIPWTLYEYYADVDVLHRQFNSAKQWVDQLERRALTKNARRRRSSRRAGDLQRYLVDTGYHWGEWLRPNEHIYGEVVKNILRPRGVVATAYLARSAEVLAKIADVLDRTEEAHHYRCLAGRVREAWRAAYVNADGRIGDDKQDDYVRALAFDLLLPEQRDAAFARLVALIVKADHHLGTGFLSTPMLLPTLVAHGRPDLAFRILLQTSSPSWLHQIERGATTPWETWEGYDKRGNAVNSHNHYAFGSVAAFLTQGIAGLSPSQPGYRRIQVSPTVGGGLTHAAATVETPFGTAASAWTLEGDTVHLSVTIPPGARADVHLGDDNRHKVGSGSHEFSWRVA